MTYTDKKELKFILIVVDPRERTQYFGPFDDGDKALDWGEEHFDSREYFLMSTTLYDPNGEKKWA
jgi:hypothetical protein